MVSGSCCTCMGEILYKKLKFIHRSANTSLSPAIVFYGWRFSFIKNCLTMSRVVLKYLGTEIYAGG